MYDDICRFLAEHFSSDFASWLMGESITMTELKKAGGRRQRAEGSFQKGIQTPPEKEPPNFQFGGGLKPLLPTVVAEDKVQFPSASCPLPSAFLDKTFRTFFRANSH